LEQELETSAGTTNQQLTSMLGYLHEVLGQVHEQRKGDWSKLSKQQSARSFQAIDTDGDGELSLAELQQHTKVLKKGGNTSDCAWIWDVVNRMNTELHHVDGEDERSGKEKLAMEAARVLEKFYCAAEAARFKLMAENYRERAQAVAQLENKRDDLDLFVKEMSTVLAYRNAKSRIEEMMEQFPRTLQLRQTFKGGDHWMKVVTLVDSCTDADVTGLKQQLSELIVTWANDCDEKHAEHKKTFKREDLVSVGSKCNQCRQCSRSIRCLACSDLLPPLLCTWIPSTRWPRTTCFSLHTCTLATSQTHAKYPI
jgi:hypothetical protein